MNRLQEEGGFTIFEVLMAAALLGVALIALTTTFDTSRGSVNGSKAIQEASHAGQQALEQVVALGYSSIALSAAPAASADANNPGFYVVGGASYKWNGPNGGSSSEALVIDPGGFASGPTAWGDARYGGQIYRYVSWGCDTAVSGAACPGKHDFKRVTVGVTLRRNGRARRPIYFQTLVTDPTAGPNP